jgi:hypothetical protein
MSEEPPYGREVADAGIEVALEALARTLAEVSRASGDRDKALDGFRDYLKAALCETD